MKSAFTAPLFALLFFSCPLFAENYNCSSKTQTHQLIQDFLYEKNAYQSLLFQSEQDRVDEMVEHYQQSLTQTYFGWLATGNANFPKDIVISCDGRVHYL